MSYKSFALAATVALALRISVKAQQTGVTTRYWDCCKQSCGWNGKAAVNQAVQSCDSQGNKLTDPNTQSGCDAGASGAFTCADNQPWAINDTYAYGFAAVNIASETESQWCCECYALTFTSGPVVGQTLIVQTTNTGGDLGANHFDLLIPGGGLGIFTDGCSAQFGGWNGGDQYGGLSNSSQCAGLPASVQAGCEWRFNWFKNADNPNVTFQKTTCPSELVAKSGCLRNDAAPPTTLPPSSGASPVTSAPPPPASSPAPPPSSSAPPPPPGPPASGTAAQWGQCGGTGYSGATACASPFKCNYVNDYYSQCF